MKTLALMLALLSGHIQNQGPMDSSGIAAPPPCIEPAGFTYIWVPTVGCSVATPCATDVVAGNNASQTTLGNLPTYGATCGPNSTPCLTFNGSSDYITPTTAIPSGLTNLTFYAVINTSTTGYNAFFGSTSNQFAEFAIINGSNVPQLAETGIAGAQGTQTISPGTWYTLIVTYANGTTTTSFYDASGGALNPQGSVSSPAMSFPNPTIDLGASRGDPNFFNGKIAEWGYTNSVNTAGIANWSSCHYGI